jgi:predicted MPP superfamily phosphohydrolase
MGLKPKTEKVRSRNQAFKDMVKDLEVEKLAAKWAVEDYNEHYFNGEKDYAPEVSDVLEYDDIDDNDYYLD